MKVNAMSNAKLMRLLLDGLYSCQQLSEETGIHYVTILEYTRALHKEKAAYICAWVKDSRGQHSIKIYQLGGGKDAKRPAPLTQAQRAERYRLRKTQGEYRA